MTNAEWETTLKRVREGKCLIAVDEDGMPMIAKELPIYELRQYIAAMARGYNEQHRRIEVLSWIARAKFNRAKKEER